MDEAASSHQPHSFQDRFTLTCDNPSSSSSSSSSPSSSPKRKPFHIDRTKVMHSSSSTGTPQNVFQMLLRSRIMKVFLVLGFSFMFTAVYVNFFQHPPPDVILAMNSRAGASDFGSQSFRQSHSAKSHNKEVDDEDDDDTGDEDDDVGKGPIVKHAEYWKRFIKRNNLVSVGAVYNQCEDWTEQIGMVAMMPDKELGGVKTRTYVNITIDKEIDGGQFNIDVKYNSKDLYDNYWELCEVEDELPPVNRTFNCPVAAGKYIKVKDRHIPAYLPKGRYESKTWASDEDEKVFACGFADFTI